MREIGSRSGAVVAAVAELERNSTRKSSKKPPTHPKTFNKTNDNKQTQPAKQSTDSSFKIIRERSKMDLLESNRTASDNAKIKISSEDDLNVSVTLPIRKRSQVGNDVVESKNCDRNSSTTDYTASRPNSTATSSDSSSDSSSSESSSGTPGVLDPISEETRQNTSTSTQGHSDEDESTCCDDDFMWMSSQPEDIAMPSPPKANSSSSSHSRPPRASPHTERSANSLDRRRPTPPNRSEREKKTRSSHSVKTHDKERPHRENHVNMKDFMIPPPPPSKHYGSQELQHRYASQDLAQYYSCPSREDLRNGYSDKEMFIRRHERSDPWRYGSNTALLDRRAWEAMGSQDHPLCCGYRQMPPPPPAHPCCQCDHRMQQWTTLYQKPGDVDERVRRLESEKESLQLQVSVLSEQISAQSDKITDLERTLSDKRSLLSNSEDLLQREMLTRSSLETQKLELMSAMSELKLQQAALERENVELRAGVGAYSNNLHGGRRPPMVPRSSPGPPLHSQVVLSPSPVTASPLPTDHSPKTPPATYRRHVELQYGSLPRQTFPVAAVLQGTVDSNANLSGGRRAVAFGKAPRAPARGYSVPNLAETERILIEDNMDSASTNGIHKPMGSASPSPVPSRNNKSLRNIFGKIRRSSSGNLEDVPSGTDESGGFSRGGVRATAGARLGWSENHNKIELDIPFKDWDGPTVINWIQNDLGLEINDTDSTRSFITNGAKLLAASIGDLNKVLSLKNPLHLKKLTLALCDLGGKAVDPHLGYAGKLDTAWVLRWLDDAGLPQYKDSFHQAQIDGRVLHRLTMDDLAALHITSLLHVASLKRGIQVLREHEWSATCMIRRSLPTDPPDITAGQIATWSAHRVMEWLKLVDLAEYATNLRGAGVHGGLMVHEPRFSENLLAALLSIPASKTLLRRHLATHFKELLGRDVIQLKREAEATLGYVPLTLTSKVKVAKKSQFSLKRRKGRSDDLGDLVCPLDDAMSGDCPSTPLPMTRAVALEEDVSEDSAAPESPLSQRNIGP